MKKIYMMPSTEVFDVKIQTILTGSDLTINHPGSGEEDTVDDPNDLLSRRHNNAWEDEEEEEDF